MTAEPGSTERGFEVVTIGRVSVDLYGEQIGVPLGAVQTFAKSVGGSPTNVAVAAARLGRRSAVVTAVGDDELGRYVRGSLEGFGVGTQLVGSHPTLLTPLVIAAMERPDDPTFVFYRAPAAPDEEIVLATEHLDAARAADILWVSGSALSSATTGATTRALLAARERRRHTILDLDYRAGFWPGEAAASREIGGAIEQASVAVGNRTECRVAVGTAEPEEAAGRLLARGVELAVVKQGAEGVLVATADERRLVPPVEVEVVSGLGAGDAFGGALCHGLLAGWSPAECVRFANAAGALVASRLLCADAMPTAAEVEQVLEGARA